MGWIPDAARAIASLALIYPWVRLYAKRLYDFGKSAGLILVPVGVGLLVMARAGLLGGLAAFGAGRQGGDAAAAGMMAGLGMSMLLIGVAGLVGLAFLLWVGLSKSDPGPNRYGAAPVSAFGGAPRIGSAVGERRRDRFGREGVALRPAPL